MTSPRYARLAAKIMTGAHTDAPLTPPSPETRARAVAAIEQAISVRAAQRRRKQWMLGACAVAAIAVCGVGIARLATDPQARSAVLVPASAGVAAPLLAPAPVIRSAGVVAVSGDGEPGAQLPDGTPLARGKRLIARPRGHATLAFATGTELSLEERGDLTIDESGASQRFTLGEGAVNARVAKLVAGERFVIATPDAEIEVHGTTFRVAVVPADPACGEGATTRVDVVEGVVVVRARGVETSVGAGERWPRGCAAPSAPAAIAAVEPRKASAAASAASAASQLTEQNDMFAEAVAAKRHGASSQAIATFDRFLAKYPSSPLVESAMAERMRLLHASDRARAQAAARQYLARFPNGFARADAQAILVEAP